MPCAAAASSIPCLISRGTSIEKLDRFIGHCLNTILRPRLKVVRSPLATVEPAIFLGCEIALAAPGLIVGFSPFRRERLPREREVSPRLIERGCGAIPEFAGPASRIETADPGPLLTMVWDADPARDRADMDVAVVDMPAILAFAITAAGELGHAPIIPPIWPDGKPLDIGAYLP